MSQVQCAAILAGGKSSRMGREKALIEIEGEPLIARIAAVLTPIFPQVFVVTNNAEIARAANLPPVADQYENRGPLGGIHAALSHFAAPTFVVACDMPFLNAEFIEFLSRDFHGNALVPLSDGGFEPLHAVYAPECAPIFESFLRGEDDRMPPFRRVLAQVEARFVPLEIARGFDPALRCFTNWNTPEEANFGSAWPET